MSNNVLVTGGAGFIGSHLVDRLLAQGDRVRVLDNLLPQAHPTGEARFLSPEAELVVGDLRNPDAVQKCLEGVDAVFHLGGMVGNGQSMYDIRNYVDANAVGTATLLSAMLSHRAQFKRLVVASSMVVYGDGAYRCRIHGRVPRVARPAQRLQRGEWEPICPNCGEEVEPVATDEEHTLAPTSTYGISKRDQEELVLVLGRAHGLPTIALRYLNVYGSRQALSNPYTGVAAIMATRLLNGRPPIIFEDGQQRRDLTHVSDIVEATLAAMEAPESACYCPFNIGSGISVTIRQIAKKLAEALGAKFEPEVTGEFREGDIRHCFADVSRARDYLAWQAKISFEEGIGELASWAAGETPEDNTDAANRELRERRLLR